ncbi:hypothetical protein [Bacillus sp. FJAT-49736]|uniref:hypothetical protein n=1 Tax=Bacillus sp. FJAT-49736 TaxID=2833582 RepID=UPI001BC9ED7F|nr:hypothetical protein [Bacillus sp. FJAT-49736]MBS4173971.1 hypothetical protein [Bacillus sp. FJAT-49736]
MQQQNQQQNQQMAMNQPPSIISTKDLSYIDDMLAWNLLAMKKAHFAAEHCQDQEVKAACEKCGEMHQRHYSQILGHLQHHLQSQQNQPFQQNQQYQQNQQMM